jgi:glutamate-1-semialdehyde 2,1-aminomutase
MDLRAECGVSSNIDSFRRFQLHQLETSACLNDLAHHLIPGGCHTYAKGDDQYPILAPKFIARGAGCRVWDTDGYE